MSSSENVVGSVLVVGAGTAGLISALMIRQQNPDLSIRVLFSSRIGHIMVGEGTFGATPGLLHDEMGLDRQAFFADVAPTPKLGVRFLWGSRRTFHYTFEGMIGAEVGGLGHMPLGYSFPQSEPLVDYSLGSALMSANAVSSAATDVVKSVKRPTAGYHFENQAFVDHLTRTCASRGIELIEAEVTQIKTCEAGIAQVETVDGRSFSADLYIDCSGFKGALVHRALKEPHVSMRDHLFCDRAVVGGWDRGAATLRPYTTAETMNAGWCWQIEHRSSVNRGYVYCSDFISDEDAEAEFRAKNPLVDQTRRVRFETRRLKRSWVGNAIAVGNANGFIEPLEATNIHLVCCLTSQIARSLKVSRCITAAQRASVNRYAERSWTSIRDFLAAHYKLNTLLDTPFWKHARAETALGIGDDIVDYYRSVGPDPTGLAPLIGDGCFFKADGWLTILLGCGVPFDLRRSLPPDEVARMSFQRRVNASLAAKGTKCADASFQTWTAL